MWPYSNSFQSTEGAGHDAAEAQLEVASHLAEAQLSRASNLLLIPIRNSGTGLLALKSGCSVTKGSRGAGPKGPRTLGSGANGADFELIQIRSRFASSTKQRRSGLPTYTFFEGRLCFPAKPQDGGAQGQGDPQYSAPGFQPSSRWSARLQPSTRERLAVFPHAQAVSSRLDEIAGWQRTKCRSSWKATLLRDG